MLPKLVATDQTGFICNCQSHLDIRHSLGIMQYAGYNKNNAVIVTLDAEKAFDRVEWKSVF